MIKIKNLSLFLFSFMLAFAACQEDPEVTGEPPTVNAGTDVNAVVGSSVQLSGIATDPDGDQLTISWTVTAAPSGSTASVNNANSLNAAFTPDVAGNYTLTLTVNDGNGNTVTDELIITATEAVGEPPVVTILGEDNRTISEANENNSVTVGTPYMLNGSNTFDQDTDADDLTFTWEITEAPAGSSEASVSADATDPAMANFVPDVVGDYTIQLTVTDPEGNSDSETAIIMADANPVEISSSISTPTVWPNVFENPSLPDYYVTADITVSEQLEVMPGVKVMFERNRGFRISGNNGALTAIGKADSLIVFTAEDSINGWDGIIIFNNNVINELTYTEVSYGGNRDATSGVGPANVGLEGFGKGRLKVNNSIFSNSFGDGLFAEDGSNFTEFTNNTFNDNTRHPLTLAAMHVGSLDVNSTFSGNGQNTVDILGSTLNIADVQTWPALAGGVSYSSPGRLLIQSGLTIMAGASFEFGSDGYLQFNGDSYLVAVGTETDSISFTASELINGWGGLFFYSNDNRNRISYASISYGGNRGSVSGVAPSSIGVEGFSNSRLKIDNSTISNSLGDYGIYVEGGALITEFANNNFINNKRMAIGIPVQSAGVIDEASTFSGNGTDAVEIYGSTLSDPITMAALADDTPYLISGRLDIDEALTIEAGANIEFDQGVVIDVGSQGSFFAVGTAEDRIIFTESNLNEGWGGIIIYSSRVVNEMSYCTVSFGGNRGSLSGVAPASIGLEGFSQARLKLTNNIINNSLGYGLFVESGATVTDDTGTELTTQTELEAAGNTFSGNTTDPSNLP